MDMPNVFFQVTPLGCSIRALVTLEGLNLVTGNLLVNIHKPCGNEGLPADWTHFPGGLFRAWLSLLMSSQPFQPQASLISLGPCSWSRSCHLGMAHQHPGLDLALLAPPLGNMGLNY